VKPVSGNGKLLWHALGAKTVELINENIHVESVRDDVETLVMDAQVLDDILKAADPEKKGKEIEIKLIARLRNTWAFQNSGELGERLEKIKERHEQGFLSSSGISQGHARTRQGGCCRRKGRQSQRSSATRRRRPSRSYSKRPRTAARTSSWSESSTTSTRS